MTEREAVLAATAGLIGFAVGAVAIAAVIWLGGTLDKKPDAGTDMAVIRSTVLQNHALLQELRKEGK